MEGVFISPKGKTLEQLKKRHPDAILLTESEAFDLQSSGKIQDA